MDLDSKNQWLKRQQYLIEKTKTQEDLMLRILQEHEKKACDLSEKLQLEYQKQQDVIDGFVGHGGPLLMC